MNPGRLERSDKWYVGGGNRLLYAPPFPLHRDAPGCWDAAHYYNYAVRPMHTWALVDDEGRPVPLRLKRRLWRPDVLVRTFVSDDTTIPFVAEERTALLPTDVLTSTVSIRSGRARTGPVRFVCWTVRENSPTHGCATSGPGLENNIFSCGQTLSPAKRPSLECGFSFGISVGSARGAMRVSEGNVPPPDWRLTPFSESSERLGRRISAASTDLSAEGLLYVAFDTVLRPTSKKDVSVTVASAMAPTSSEASANLSMVLKRRDPIALSSLSWNDHFSSVPEFRSSDVYLEMAYWHRWYGLRLNTIYGGEKNYEYPVVCEGIEYFRAPISYSAPCHMYENRWMHEPEIARGSLLTFLQNQRPDGGFRGYIDARYYRDEMFYHANWGRALLALDAHHPSDSFLQRAYEGLKKYASYFDRERDEEVSGLYDIDNHYETGQEYMRRYTAVNPKADEDNWGEVFRLKGVDVTVYIYELKRALAQVAERLGRPDEAEVWGVEADRTRRAVLEKMWDPEEEMFFDIDPTKGTRTGVKAATCFYPYFTDIVGKAHLAGFKRHLFSPKEFWTPFPVPSTSRDDPSFSAEPVWKGKRMNCPWNGRVWPMTNSHIMDALVTCALRFGDKQVEKKAGEFMMKFVRMMTFDGDPNRPNAFEHYNPLTGAPSHYRGIDDYMHSWTNDLILKYVMGIQATADEIRVRPLQMGLRSASVKNVMIRGRRLSVEIRGETFWVTLDGKSRVEGTLGETIELQA